MTGPMPLDPELPKGVMSSRMSAMRDERIETAKVITQLEQVGVNTMNKIIRARVILSEVSVCTVKPAILAAIDEALSVLEEPS